MEQIKIKCKRCQGSGVVDLSNLLGATLGDLNENAQTTDDLMDKAARDGRDINMPALCMRLKFLERLGLARKEKTTHPTGGAWYLWFRV
jgi:hypothetical protein